MTSFLKNWSKKCGRHSEPTTRRIRRRPRTLQLETLDRRELLAAAPWVSSAAVMTDLTRASAATSGPATTGSAVTPAVSSDWFAAVRKDSINVAPRRAIQGTFQGETYTAVANQWLVKLSDTQKVTSVKDADKLLAKQKLKVICGLGMTGWIVVDAKGAGKTASAQEKALRGNTNIAVFEPNRVIQGTAVRDVVNDPRAGELWGLDKIDVSGAWQVSKGSRAITVAVTDTGVGPHTDLTVNMWRNPGEIPGNRKDDDGNGFVDDVNGYDFYAKDSDPSDKNGHGTHVAGTIGAVGNNGIGVVGVNQEVSIMAVRMLGPDGSGSWAGAAQAVNYVTMMRSRGVNCPVINASWGGAGTSQVLYDAIKAAGSQQVLFVAAAGNDGTNTDFNAFYPAGYDLPNIVSVAATNDTDQLAWFSNYGAKSVDIAAPGVGILSTVPGNRYESWNGTSMAAPHVSGVAALAVAKAGSMSVDNLRTLLLTNVDILSQLSGKVGSGGRLNAARTLNAVDSKQPLVLDGTSGNDRIEMRDRTGDPNTYEVWTNGRLERSGSWSTLSSITINGKAGDDQISVLTDPYAKSRIPVTIHGGDGNDQLGGSWGNDLLYGDAGNDLIYGNAGNDLVYGGSGDDRLNGGWGEDALSGEAGVDFLYGDEAADSFDGGAERDWYGDFVQGVDRGEIRNDRYVSLVVDGTSVNDTIEMRARDGDASTYEVWLNGRLTRSGLWDTLVSATLNGQAGDDRIWVIDPAPESDIPMKLNGGDGNDRLDGSWGDDILNGGAGNDVLYGNGSNDHLYGGGGDDRLNGGWGEDWLYGETGVDYLYGDECADWFDGGQERDWYGDFVQGVDSGEILNDRHVSLVVDGTSGDDTIEMRARDGDASTYEVWLNGRLTRSGLWDTLVSATLNGQAGDDRIWVIDPSPESDIPMKLNGGDGNDRLDGSWGDDILSGGAGNDLLYGNGSNDHLYGGGGDDRLNGGWGEDRLYGEDGADVLCGDESVDTLYGGAGADMFYGGAERDVYLDFLQDVDKGELP